MVASVGIALMCLSAVFGRPAAAAAEIQGGGADLQLRLENASVREVLDLLSGKFKLTYTLTSLPNRQLTGRYSGTLSEVLARLLDGSDYIVEVSGDSVKVVIVSGPAQSPRGASAPASQVKESTAQAAPMTPPSQSPAKAPPPPLAPPLASYLTMSHVPAAPTP
jgi:hypothetical protein